MTREEIIKGLEDYIPWADEYEVDIEVLTGALELLKKEPCGDLISRQAVIESICKQYTEHNAIVPIWLSIGDLPSVTPTQNCVENALGALDCISRQAVLEKQYRIDDSATLSTRDVVNVDDIEDLPPVNPQEPRKGHWIEHHKSKEFGSIYKCSLCENLIGKRIFKYCPECGARMESEDKE